MSVKASGTNPEQTAEARYSVEANPAFGCYYVFDEFKVEEVCDGYVKEDLDFICECLNRTEYER